MRLRILIFDDDAAIRQVLRLICHHRNHEVLAFPDPRLCPLHIMDRCPCRSGTVCADVIISDLNMPEVQGLDFLEALRTKLCTVPHLGIISGAWSKEATARAVTLGCHLMAKPFQAAEIIAWLDRVEALVSPQRELLDWATRGWPLGPIA